MVGQRTDGPRGEPERRAARTSASRGAPARVLLVDDHDMIRRGLRRVLGTQPDLEVVGEAADGREALEQARRLRPDVVLMDVRMPVMDGLEATRRLKAEMPGVCVLMVTAYEESGYLLEAIQAGAAGYVPKGEPTPRLVGAIRGALGGETPLDQEPPRGSSEGSRTRSGMVVVAKGRDRRALAVRSSISSRSGSSRCWGSWPEGRRTGRSPRASPSAAPPPGPT